MQNAGRDVKFEQDSDPLPLTLRGGAAYVLDLNRFEALSEAAATFNRFVFTADAIRVRDQPTTAATGLEMQFPFGPESVAALRFGYTFNDPTQSVSLGFGMREGRFIVDYAFGVRRDVTNEHHVSLGVRL
jgi:hypothetical protein